MSKLVRCLGPLTLIMSLISCDLFFFPVEGRWNILDPKNDLVWVEVLVPVEVDGYVDATEKRYFDTPLLIADWNPSPLSAPVIRFDYSKLPLYIETAFLEMYTTAATIAPSVEIYVTGQRWDPTSLRWIPIYDGTIVDFDCPFTPAILPLPVLDGYNIVDLTEVVKYTAENPDTYGFLFAWSGGIVEFHSSRGPNPPILRVSGWDVVE